MVEDTNESIKLVLGETTFDSPEVIRSNTVKILEEIANFQKSIRKLIDDNYVNFMPNHSTFDAYIDEGEKLLRESEHLLSNVGSDARMGLSKANLELVQCVDQLRESSLGLKVSQRILTIGDLFQSVEKANSIKDYLTVLDLIAKLRSLICTDAANEAERIFQKCECYNGIKVKYHIQANILEQNLQQRFENLVHLNEKTFPNTKNVTLRLSKDVEQLQGTVMALFQARYNPMKVCDFLLENCLLPIIMKPVSLELSNENLEYVELNISYSLKELTNKSLKPSYKQVFGNINQLFECLSNINVKLSSGQYVFTIIGNRIKDRLMNTLINECLLDAIPDTMDEYQQSTLVQDILNFEQLLTENYLINKDNDIALNEFTSKFERLFRNRFNKKIIDSAREIMHKDLQDMTVVAEGNSMEEINKNAFLFPQCKISKNCLEIVKLMEHILQEATNNESIINVDADADEPEDTDTAELDRFTLIIRNILNMYITEIPKIHKKLLESIPQQSALFHNNCMFLAHWISTNAQIGIPTHTALISTLQTAGQQQFKAQISYQQNIITQILKDFDLSDPHSLGTGPIKLIQQCLRQMGLLKNVWINVLPDSIYNRTFCDIVNDFCQDIIKRILCLEDISTTVANELSEIIDIILEKAPQLFRDNCDVIQVQCWMKLQQLKMILNASLHEIVEHWCNGAGILTVNYKADEVRHLIRALFQNTDRRASALSKII